MQKQRQFVASVIVTRFGDCLIANRLPNRLDRCKQQLAALSKTEQTRRRFEIPAMQVSQVGPFKRSL